MAPNNSSKPNPLRGSAVSGVRPHANIWRDSMRSVAFITLIMLAFVMIPGAAIAQLKPAGVQSYRLSMRFQELVPRTSSDEVHLHFSGYHDTRCPSDVECAWAGEAYAFFWLTGRGIKPQVLSLPWSGNASVNSRHPVRVGNYEFTMRSLEPRPMVNRVVSPTQYKAVVEVRLHEPAKTSNAR